VVEPLCFFSVPREDEAPSSATSLDANAAAALVVVTARFREASVWLSGFAVGVVLVLRLRLALTESVSVSLDLGASVDGAVSVETVRRLADDESLSFRAGWTPPSTIDLCFHAARSKPDFLTASCAALASSDSCSSLDGGTQLRMRSSSKSTCHGYGGWGGLFMNHLVLNFGSTSVLPTTMFAIFLMAQSTALIVNKM